jgi:hypothetical protein
MKTSLTLGGATALLFAFASAQAEDTYTDYIGGAEKVVAALKAGADPASQVAPLNSLVAHADALIDPFAVRYPACADYLRASRQLTANWESLSLAQIEKDYHHDAALPAIADPKNRALCYQMKDLLVHPLTALRMLRETPIDRAGVEHEIVEVIAHGKALQALMAQ